MNSETILDQLRRRVWHRTRSVDHGSTIWALLSSSNRYKLVHAYVSEGLFLRTVTRSQNLLLASHVPFLADQFDRTSMISNEKMPVKYEDVRCGTQRREGVLRLHPTRQVLGEHWNSTRILRHQHPCHEDPLSDAAPSPA